MWPFSKATRSGVFPSCILRIIINNKSPKCYATGTQFNNSMRRSLISVIVMAKDRATIILCLLIMRLKNQMGKLHVLTIVKFLRVDLLEMCLFPVV